MMPTTQIPTWDDDEPLTLADVMPDAGMPQDSEPVTDMLQQLRAAMGLER
jgi:hypothetical protein